MQEDNREGFTLIELSISLVIIGLIVGGILGARDLIRQAELRSVVADFNGYISAINTFQLKYNGLPGDIRNASAYWPSCDGTPANCNGDGDSRIDVNGEDLRAWQQLGDSGIIPGSYLGVQSGGSWHVPDVTIPSAPIESGAYWFVYTSGAIYGKWGNLIALSAPSSSLYLLNSIVSPPDAKSIDEKMDDGLAALGKIRSVNGANTAGGCINTTPDPDEYNLSLTAVGCRVFLFTE